MKQLLLIGATLLALGAGASAQQIDNTNNTNQNANGAILPLPEGIEKVVSIDAFNILLAQSNRDGRSELSPIIVRHVYSGGIARLFGGDIVPTSQFVSPGLFNGNGGGQNNGGNGNNGIQNGGGQNNGGQNSFGGGFQNGGGNGGGNGGAGNFGGSTNFSAFQMRRFGRRN